MQILRATSRSINKDLFYQSEQDKRKQIHIQKIRVISSSPLQPLKTDSAIQKHLRKAKSAAKIFQEQQIKMNQRLENKSLLNKLIKVQSPIKSLWNKQTIDTIEKPFNTSSNWLQRKKESQKAKKEHELLTKRCEQIANTDIKNIKKKMQEQIKEYLQLRDNIRKMKPVKQMESKKRTKSFSFKKISMGLPLVTESNSNQLDNQQDHLAQKQQFKSKFQANPKKCNNQSNQRQGQI